jgi:CRP-like cAMP-binding protein
VTNFSRPAALSRYGLRVKLPPELDPDRARRVLLAAVAATVGREHGPSPDKSPDVLIADMEASGVDYWIRFWLDPATKSSDTIIDTVWHSVLRHLQIAGIPLSERGIVLNRETHRILDPESASARTEVLGNIALFKGIEPAALGKLAAATELAGFRRGDRLITQGETDNDMFVIVEGAVEVLAETDGKEVAVAHMQAGDYFGEMSLLTGEPRTASIRAITNGAVYQVSRGAVAPLLAGDASVLKLLSRNLAERNLNRSAKVEAALARSAEQTHKGLAATLLDKMRAIFSGS